MSLGFMDQGPQTRKGYQMGSTQVEAERVGADFREEQVERRGGGGCVLARTLSISKFTVWVDVLIPLRATLTH